MPITLDKADRTTAIASIERYFREHMEEPIGNVTASALLQFFIDEVGPAIYNQAVADVQNQLRERIEALSYEVYEEPFAFWPAQRKSSPR